MPEYAEIVKSGERRISITLHRTHLGLTITAKVHAEIEEFLRSLGKGASVDVNAYGRTWTSLEKGKPLLAYDMHTKLPPSPVYDLAYLGNALILDSGQVNLSFLRLVGISEGAGVSFGVKQVYAQQGIDELKEGFIKAGVRFYQDYMKPIHATVVVSTQELRL